ncbi:MAG: hypothetical protein AAF721_35165, partial [Myxococcota bacterium]
MKIANETGFFGAVASICCALLLPACATGIDGEEPLGAEAADEGDDAGGSDDDMGDDNGDDMGDDNGDDMGDDNGDDMGDDNGDDMGDD